MRAFRESSQALHLVFTLTEDDHIAYAQWVNWQRPERRYYRWGATAFPILIFVVAVLVHPNTPLLSPGNGIYLALSLVACGITPLWVRYRLGQRVKRHLRGNPDAGLVGDFQLEMTPDVLAVTGPKGRAEMHRGRYFDPVETKAHWFLFVGKKAAFLVPRGPFEFDEQEDIRASLQHFGAESPKDPPPA